VTGARLALASALVAVLIMAGFALDYGLALHAISGESHSFCAVTRLITAHPVPRPADPQANPSRLYAWELYSDFVTLQHRLGC
jgi:hypothetical protein